MSVKAQPNPNRKEGREAGGGREVAKSENGGGASVELTPSTLAGTRIMGKEMEAGAQRP